MCLSSKFIFLLLFGNFVASSLFGASKLLFLLEIGESFCLFDKAPTVKKANEGENGKNPKHSLRLQRAAEKVLSRNRIGQNDCKQKEHAKAQC